MLNEWKPLGAVAFCTALGLVIGLLMMFGLQNAVTPLESGVGFGALLGLAFPVLGSTLELLCCKGWSWNLSTWGLMPALSVSFGSLVGGALGLAVGLPAIPFAGAAVAVSLTLGGFGAGLAVAADTLKAV